MTTSFPKYFAIKCPANYATNTTWKEYIKWLNNYAKNNGVYSDFAWSGTSIGSFYGITQFNSIYGNTDMWYTISSFSKTVKVSLEDWDSYFNKKETMVSFPPNTYVEMSTSTKNKKVVEYLIKQGFKNPRGYEGNGYGDLGYGLDNDGVITYFTSDKYNHIHVKLSKMTFKEFESKYLTPNTPKIKNNNNMQTTPTKQQILDAAKTSVEAKAALAKLFPDYFKPELNSDIHVIPSRNLSYSTGLDDLNEFLKSKGQAIIACGIAPYGKNLENKVVGFDNNQDMVVFDRYSGEELHRIHMDRVFIGFADHK